MSDALRLLIGNAGYSNNIVPEHKLEVQERDSSRPTPSNISSSSNSSPKLSNSPITSQGYSVVKNPPSVSVNFGVFVVEEIQLWVMGSHGPNNEYISCGGVILE